MYYESSTKSPEFIKNFPPGNLCMSIEVLELQSIYFINNMLEPEHKLLWHDWQGPIKIALNFRDLKFSVLMMVSKNIDTDKISTSEHARSFSRLGNSADQKKD